VKICLALVVTSLMGTVTAAHADVFKFSDLEGFEKCLNTEFIVEKSKSDEGEQARGLDQVEIQMKCVAAAVKLIAPQKKKDVDLEFIGAVKRLSAPENSLDLVNVLVDHGLANCNEMSGYEVLMKSLDAPKNTSKSSYHMKAKTITKRCLKDKDFKKDFMEETDKPEGYFLTNVCEILIEEKLIKSCPAKASK
jgi:hypothetical protein